MIASSGLSKFMSDFALTWLPILFFLLMCAVVYLFWKTVKLMPRVKPTEITPGSESSVTWDDVAGLEEAKEELQEIVDFLRDPQRFEALGARGPKGVRANCCNESASMTRPTRSPTGRCKAR